MVFNSAMAYPLFTTLSSECGLEDDISRMNAKPLSAAQQEKLKKWVNSIGPKQNLDYDIHNKIYLLINCGNDNAPKKIVKRKGVRYAIGDLSNCTQQILFLFMTKTEALISGK